MVCAQPGWGTAGFVKQRYWLFLAWLAALGLLALAVRAVSWSEIVAVARRFELWQVATWLAVNVGVFALFGLRWGFLLRVQGHFIPFQDIMRYRLAAFGVSYFTPGPHFGGEPLQVYYLVRNHQVPAAVATAVITLDKVFEMLANFTFLAVGVATVAASGLLGAELGWELLPGLLLALPALYLLGLWRGVHPLSVMVAGLAQRWPRLGRASVFVMEAETHMGKFCQTQPRAMLTAFVLSGVVWVGLVLEFGLMLNWLGVPMNLVQLITVMTAARLALLTPLPGALGALEGGQALAFAALGFGAEAGLAAGLLIRGRDVGFGLLGLAWSGMLTRRGDRAKNVH